MAPQQAHWRLFVHTAKCFWRCNVSKQSIIFCPWKKRSSRSMYAKLEWEAIQLLQMLVHHVLHKWGPQVWSFEHLVAYPWSWMNIAGQMVAPQSRDIRLSTSAVLSDATKKPGGNVFRWTCTVVRNSMVRWLSVTKKCWNLRPFTSHQNTRTNT